MAGMARSLVVRAPIGLGWWASVSSAYLLALLVTARAPARRSDPGGSPPRAALRLLVLIPAHDEETGIGETVRALIEADYDRDRRQIVVIADNCGDETGSVAARAGADVWTRQEPERSGKGQAVAWALMRAGNHHDAVVTVDADCIASPNLLAALSSAVAAGADAAQARYVASNPTASPAAALRYAGFALINSLRPRAKSRLGLSAGLLGSGMAFPNRTLESVPWHAFSVTEDREYHLRLIEAGLKVRFVEEAWVSSAMPETHGGGAAQQMRWDTGNVLLARRFVPRLIVRGIRHRSADSMHAAVELLIPPQALLAALGMTTLFAGVALRARLARWLGVFSLLAQAGFVLGGLRAVGAPPEVFRALLHAPALILRRLSQSARIVAGRGARSWVRTDRASKQLEQPPSSRDPDGRNPTRGQ